MRGQLHAPMMTSSRRWPGQGAFDDLPIQVKASLASALLLGLLGLGGNAYLTSKRSAGIGIGGAFAAVVQARRGGDQLEVGVLAVLGIDQNFGRRHVEATCLDGFDKGRRVLRAVQGRAVPGRSADQL